MEGIPSEKRLWWESCLSYSTPLIKSVNAGHWPDFHYPSSNLSSARSYQTDRSLEITPLVKSVIRTKGTSDAW